MTSDPDLLNGFRSGTLRAFPHEDHLRVVYLLVGELGPDEALVEVSAGIRAMAAAAGLSEKFHLTRTIAWTRLVAAAVARDAESGATATDSAGFLARHPELLRRDLLEEYYDPGRLTSPEARAGWVEPERPITR